MSKRKKLWEKVLSGSKNIRFEEFVSLLVFFSFELVRTRGSHRVYKHPHVSELLSVQPRKDGHAKPYQVQQFLSLVEAYELTLEDTEEEGEE